MKPVNIITTITISRESQRTSARAFSMTAVFAAPMLIRALLPIKYSAPRDTHHHAAHHDRRSRRETHVRTKHADKKQQMNLTSV